MDDQDTLKNILSRATEELNKTNGDAREVTLFDKPPRTEDLERLWRVVRGGATYGRTPGRPGQGGRCRGCRG